MRIINSFDHILKEAEILQYCNEVYHRNAMSKLSKLFHGELHDHESWSWLCLGENLILLHIEIGLMILC